MKGVEQRNEAHLQNRLGNGSNISEEFVSV
jgi:hypothetical protein